MYVCMCIYVCVINFRIHATEELNCMYSFPQVYTMLCCVMLCMIYSLGMYFYVHVCMHVCMYAFG